MFPNLSGIMPYFEESDMLNTADYRMQTSQCSILNILNY